MTGDTETEVKHRIAYYDALHPEEDLVVEPCAGTAPASIAAERSGADWLAIDIEPEAKQAFHRRFATACGPQTTLGEVSG